MYHPSFTLNVSRYYCRTGVSKTLPPIKLTSKVSLFKKTRSSAALHTMNLTLLCTCPWCILKLELQFTVFNNSLTISEIYQCLMDRTTIYPLTSHSHGAFYSPSLMHCYVIEICYVIGISVRTSDIILGVRLFAT